MGEYIEIITRNLHKNKDRLNELYGIDMSDVKKINTNSETFLDDIFSYAETQLQKLGIANENSFFYIFQNNKGLNELHKRHVIMQAYIFLKRNADKEISLSKYMQDSATNDSKGKSSNYVLTYYTNKFKNNLLDKFFCIEKYRDNPVRFHVRDSYGLLFRELCKNADKGPFYKYSIADKTEKNLDFNKLNDLLDIWQDIAVDDLCKYAYYLYSNISSLKKTDRNNVKYKSNLEAIKKEANTVIKIYEEYSAFFIKLKNFYEQCDELRFFEDAYNQSKNIMSEYNLGAILKYNDIFPCTLIRNGENHFKKIVESKKKRIEQRLQQNNSKIDNIKVNAYSDELNNSFTSFQKNYFKKIYGLSYDKSKIADTLSMHYFTEQLLNYTTVMYLISTIKNYKSESQLNDILPSIVYIFTIPNIYLRKCYIDSLLKFYIDKDVTVCGGYHEYNIKTHEKSKNYLNTTIKRFLLNMSLTYIPMLEVCFYNALWSSFDVSEESRKQEILKILEKALYNEEYELYKLAKGNHFSFEEDKDLFLQIYDAILKYLYNDVQLKKWKKGLNIDYLKEDEYIKLIASMIEFERTNIFDSNIKSKYYPKY